VSKKGPLLIWFDQRGNMLDQAYGNSSWASNYGYKSEEAKDFDDQMEVIKIKEYRRKNSRILLKSTTSGREYTMYVDDFNALLDKKRVHNLQIQGTFHFIKKSSGQAIKLLDV
jgi:hypothetical protein